ncbi:MAG: hypothetical protein OER90_13720, partial [Gemmatimonadota bacterium]|nr:hypothetical protein [Gemmatimonadota bacterium]
ILIDPPTTGFDIDVHFLTPVTVSQEAAFTAAAAKWESVITGDLPTELVSLPLIFCGGVLDEYVDDVAINALIGPIDGVGGTLGFASFCWPRNLGGGVWGLPAYGIMVFDSDDVVDLETNGQLNDVVLHEMGHVLGIGSLWDIFGNLEDDGGLIDDRDDCIPIDDDTPLPTDPFFNGTTAIAAFEANGGLNYMGNKVPAENDYGPGTRCVHWRENVLVNELMTGFAELPGTAMPLSEVTVKSLGDLGYTVATSGWDPWTCPNCGPPPPAGMAVENVTAGKLQLINDVWLGPVYSRDEQGQIIELVPDRRR